MSSVHTSRTCGRTRDGRRSPEVDRSTESISSLDPPWKKGGFRSAEEANTAFWDNLSRVPLSPAALRELDRRNWLSVGLTSKSTVRFARRTTRSATRRAAQLDCQRSTLLESRAVQLKRFAKRGGPDLHDLRGYSDPSKPFPTMLPKSDNPPQMSARDPAFGEHLAAHDIYLHPYKHPSGQRIPKPDNWEEIQQMTQQRRSSLSQSQFSDGTFERYTDIIAETSNEDDVITNALSIMRGQSTIPSYGKRRFVRLTPLTDGTLVNPELDVCDGAHPSQFDREILKELKSYIVPCANGRAPVLPNNFTEAKGPRGVQEVLQRQACYDGALGARGIQQLQSYGQPNPIYDNNAYTITSTYNGQILQMYTTHLTAPVNHGDRPKYHMNLLGGWNLLVSPETFRQAVTAYRNAREWAKEKRDELIDTANGYNEPSTPTNLTATLESGTNSLRKIGRWLWVPANA